MPPWKKRFVAVTYGEMARKPDQVPAEPVARLCAEAASSPVSQIRNGLRVNPAPGWEVQRSAVIQPSTGTSTGRGDPATLSWAPTVPTAMPTVKRASFQLPTSSRPEAPTHPSVDEPRGPAVSSTARLREARTYSVDPGADTWRRLTSFSTNPFCR